MRRSAIFFMFNSSPLSRSLLAVRYENIVPETENPELILRTVVN